MGETLPGGTVSAGAATASAGVAVAALVIGLAALLARRGTSRQTTLIAPWWWAVAALAAWSGVELSAALAGSAFPLRVLAPLRFAAIALSLCPIVSLLGAKRPQHAAWNFVVLALFGIVALPSGEALLLGKSLELGAGRSWFLLVLVALTPINYLPTRYWPGALLVALGQTVALWPHFPVATQPLIASAGLAGLACCSIALAVSFAMSSRPAAAINDYDRLWRDFRDSFGLFWAVRVQERVNAAARQYGWNLALAWSGFVRATDDQPLTTIDPEIERTLRVTLTGLLRRFVSRAWIAVRMDREAGSESGH